jgi:hypothetical protein
MRRGRWWLASIRTADGRQQTAVFRRETDFASKNTPTSKRGGVFLYFGGYFQGALRLALTVKVNFDAPLGSFGKPKGLDSESLCGQPSAVGGQKKQGDLGP